jgi:hypothetical protein
MAKSIEVWVDWPEWAASRPIERPDGTTGSWDGAITVDSESYRTIEEGVLVTVGKRQVLLPWARVIAVFRSTPEGFIG